jgi:hypothetical protein
MSYLRIAASLVCVALINLGCLGETSVDSVNTEPILLGINVNPITIAPNDTSNISVVAFDQDNDALTITYSASGGTIVGNNETAIFKADSAQGVKSITVKIVDGRGGEADGSASLNVAKNPELITLATQVLEQGMTGTQCLLFHAQATEEMFMLGLQITNPSNASITNPVQADTLLKGVPLSLQGQGLCYTKYSGTYRFIFALTRPDSSAPFTFETTYVQP